MKTKQRVQTLFKILRILTFIGLICSILGFIFSIGGIIILNIINEDSFIYTFLNDNNITLALAKSSCINALSNCVCSIATLILMLILLKKELIKGTPFDHEFVKDLRKFSLFNIGLAIIYSIFIAIIDLIFKSKSSYNIVGNTILNSLFWLIISLIFDYGADLENKGKIDERDINS